MKTLLTAALALFTVQLQAQITITDVDMPAVDDTFRLSTAVDPGIDVLTTGANQTWDYSYLEAVTQDIDTIFPVDYAPFTYQLLFDNQILYPNHKATYAQRGQEFDLAGTVTFSEVLNFTKLDASASQMVGFGAKINGAPLPIQYDDIENVYEFPLEFGDVDSSNFSFGQAVPTLGYYGAVGTRYNEVDGWGTLITPYGSFQTIRVRSTIVRTDSLYLDLLGFGINIPRNSVEYKWLGAGAGVPLLQINANEIFGNETIGAIIYPDSVREVSVFSIAEQELESEITLYPNPAQDLVTLDFESATNVMTIDVMDAQGRVVLSKTPNRNTLREQLNVAELSNGLYFVKITAKEGVKTQRLLIAR